MNPRRVPLYQRIRRKHHREIAMAQDIAVEIFYSVFSRGVLHGGTAIWRCYSGNRFSEDIDVYVGRDPKRIDGFFEALKKRGFEVVKKRIKENALYSTLKFGETEMRIEAIFKRVRGVIKEYETYEGNLLNVYTLTPETMICEKIDAYLKRRKIRDLYDIFFLLRSAEKSERLRSKLLNLLQNFKQPADEKELKVLLLFGAIPGKEDMLEYMKRWVG
ncbi:MAG: nucleotidyl transferase AbiEii/AbiGii toxin family protein [Candidatus Hadarchaeota archaeon]|nr:nucleotidyl transferase AbiEii/AbiGii toxin family protein [Candidatus Hadarchaeota archaeon]